MSRKKFDLFYGFYNQFGDSKIRLNCDVVIEQLEASDKKSAIFYCLNRNYPYSLYITDEGVVLCRNEKSPTVIKVINVDADVYFSEMKPGRYSWRDETEEHLSEAERKSLPDYRLAYCERDASFQNLPMSIQQVFEKLEQLEEPHIIAFGNKEYRGYELIRRKCYLKEKSDRGDYIKQDRDVLHPEDNILSEYELYCNLVEEGEIEIYDFYGNADDKNRFLKKWKEKYHNDYIEDEISLYIGRHNYIGDFYECMEDFCSTKPGEQVTSQKKLIYEILKDRGEINLLLLAQQYYT